MPAGRPRKPIEAKQLEGTYRQDRDGPPQSAVPVEGVPQRPASLSGPAGELWDSIVPGLVSRRIAGESDTSALVAMCEWWGCYRRNMDALAGIQGWALAEDTARTLQISAAEASRQFHTYAARFGLTPADRARLRIEPAKKAAVPTRQRA